MPLTTHSKATDANTWCKAPGRRKTVLGVALLLILTFLGVLAWASSRSHQDPSPEPGERRASGPTQTAKGDAQVLASAGADSSRAPAPPGRTSLPVPMSSCTIIGLCVDSASSAPVAGVVVTHYLVPDAGDGKSWIERSCRSDSSGRFRLEVESPDSGYHEIVVGGERWCARRVFFSQVATGEERDLGTVELVAGTVVTGVVRYDDGGPVEHGAILVRAPDVAMAIGERQAPFHYAHLSPDGSFRLGPMPEGRHTLQLDHQGLDVVSGQELEVPEAPAPPILVTLTVRRLPVVRVLVSDERGSALAEAVVRPVLRWSASRVQMYGAQRTDERGEAMWPAAEFHGAESIELWCWASGFRAAKTELGERRDGRVEVRLAAGVATQLCVREAQDGAPIEQFAVAHWQDCPMLPRTLVETVVPAGSHQGGRCDLTGLGVLDRIVVRASGYCESEVVSIAERDLRSGCVTVELERPAELTVVCHGLDGESDVSDERVIEVLTGEVGESALVPAARPRDPAAATSDHGPRVVGRGVVDATGRTLIRGLRPGQAWLRPVGWWCQPFSHGPIELRGGERAEAVVEVAEGSTVSGSLVPAESAAWIGEIRLTRKDGSLRLPYPGQGALEFDGSGAFHWTGIPRGEWLVEVARVAADYRFDANGDVTRAQVSAWTAVAELSIPEPGSFTQTLDVTRLIPGSLRGRVASVDRAALAEMVQVRPVGMQNGVRWIGAAVGVGEDGVFAARELPPGEYRWMLELRNTEGVRTAVPLVESVTIRPGRENVQTLTVATTRSVSLVFGEEVRGYRTGQFSLSYEIASGMPAARYRIAPDGRTTVPVAVGEPFLIQTERHGFIRPKLNATAQQEPGPVEYSVGAR